MRLEQIVPSKSSPKRDFKTHVSHIVGALTTKRSLLGSCDLWYIPDADQNSAMMLSSTFTVFLFKPNLPFMKKSRQAPFFGLQDSMPVVLALLLGFLHALSAAFSAETTQYLVSTSLVVCGILSGIQVARFHIYKTPYYVGTGLISVVGTSCGLICQVFGVFMLFVAIFKAVALESICQIHSSDIHVYSRNIQKK